MKKQKKLPAASSKLSLNKKTISNLNEKEMNRKVGGTDSYYHQCGHCGSYNPNCGHTKNGNTCPGHNTCYTC